MTVSSQAETKADLSQFYSAINIPQAPCFFVVHTAEGLTNDTKGQLIPSFFFKHVNQNGQAKCFRNVSPLICSWLHCTLWISSSHPGQGKLQCLGLAVQWELPNPSMFSSASSPSGPPCLSRPYKNEHLPKTLSQRRSDGEKDMDHHPHERMRLLLMHGHGEPTNCLY
jgi:hypothetical protein